MIRICNLAGLVLVVLIPISPVRADTILVPTDQTSIADALAVAVAGDSIVVECGDYLEPNQMNMKSGVVLRSETGEPDCATVTMRRGFYCLNVDATARIEGLTLVDEQAVYDGWPAMYCVRADLTVSRCRFEANYFNAGGGAFHLSDSDPIIIECEFVGCRAAGDGGAIRAYHYSTPQITGCLFEGNEGAWGGALAWNDAAAPVVSDCEFRRNVARTHGGAISAYSSGQIIRCTLEDNYTRGSGGGLVMGDGGSVVSECLFLGNEAGGYGGGALTAAGGGFHYEHCTFVGNRAAVGGGMAGYATVDNTIIAFSEVGGAVDPDSAPYFTCSNLFGNVGGDWEGGAASQLQVRENFSADPQFCDPHQTNFHLASTSPCIDHSPCGPVGAFGEGCTQAAPPLVWHVLADGSGDAPTVAAALDSAWVGDTIELECGTYYEHDVALRGSVTLRSATGSAACATIDAGGAGRVLVGVGCESSSLGPARVDGLTLTGGSMPTYGGGIYLEDSTLELNDCRIASNGGAGRGGGVYLSPASELVARGCEFSFNTVYGAPGRGGALYVSTAAAATIESSVFRRNESTHDGGAIFKDAAMVSIDRCTFVENDALEGGGVYALGGSAAISACIFAFGTQGEAIVDPAPTYPVSCTNIYGNAGGDWVGGIAVFAGLYDNFSEPPEFCDLASGDLHLWGCSPCVDRIGCGTVGALGVGDCGHTWNVPGDAGTVAEALNQACVGDVVELSCGTYAEHDLVLPSGITLRSVSGDPGCAVLDAQGLGRVMACTDADSGTTIQGVTFTGGLSGPVWPADGGSALQLWNSSVLVLDCRFVQNTAGVDATVLCWGGTGSRFSGCEFSNNVAANSCGGLYLIGCQAIEVQQCSFIDNECSVTGGYGGAMMTWDADVALSGCRFSNNVATHGGAVRFGWQSTVSLTRSVFDANTAIGEGAAIFSDAASLSVSQCTLQANSAASGGGALVLHAGSASVDRSIIAFGTEGGAVVCNGAAAPAVSCSDIFANVGGDWVGCIADQLETNGNFSEDPRFCGSEAGDLTLTESSPCAVGNHPSGVACDGIGAYEVGCPDPVAVADTHPWFSAPTLLLAAPNPFLSKTEVAFELPSAATITLRVYDLAGRSVRTILRESKPAGHHQVVWDGRDDAGHQVSSGIYLVRLTVGKRSQSQKVIRIAR